MGKARRGGATMGTLDGVTFLVSNSELLVNHPETCPLLALSGAIPFRGQKPPDPRLRCRGREPPARGEEVMGWFLRKSFRVGPLRLNLSKRGIGASVGVKGARLGVDATGKPYAAGGRYGVYFRERLGPSRPGQAVGGIESSAEGQTPHPSGRRRWMVVVLALVIGIILGVVLA